MIIVSYIQKIILEKGETGQEKMLKKQRNWNKQKSIVMLVKLKFKRAVGQNIFNQETTLQILVKMIENILKKQNGWPVLYAMVIRYNV